MKNEIKWVLRIGGGLFGLYLCIHYWPMLTGLLGMVLAASLPLIIGALIAYLVNILMTFYERHYFPRTKKKVLLKSRRPVCMVGAILSMLGIIGLIVWLILPELVDCIMLLLNLLPGAISMVLNYAEELHILPEDIINFLEGIDWKSRVGELINLLGSGFGSVMDTLIKTLTTLFSGIVTALLAIIFALYILIGKDAMKAQGKRMIGHYVKPDWAKKFFYVLGIFDDSMHKYIVGQCTEAVVLGALCTTGMLIFRFPYATMIGALVGFTALIPVAGAYIGAGVGAFMILTVSPMKALLFLVFILVLQQLEGNIIYPRVVGSSLGLPGIWVLAAVTVGGGVMGIAGMFLGVPLTAAVYRLVAEDMERKEDLTAAEAVVPVTVGSAPANPENAPEPKPKSAPKAGKPKRKK